jgi:hypothetical protein
MSKFTRLFRLRLLPVLILFGYVSNLANTNYHVAIPVDLGFVSPEHSLAAPPLPGDSVRHELARLQEQTGLSFVLVENNAFEVLILIPPSTI